MSKNKVEVIINKKVYQLCGSESEEYLHQLARHIDRKITELSQTSNFDKMSLEYQQLSMSLNLADDYLKCKEKLEKLEKEVEKKDEQLFETKHEMVDLKMKSESLEKIIEEYKRQLTKLQKEVVELERKVNHDKK